MANDRTLLTKPNHSVTVELWTRRRERLHRPVPVVVPVLARVRSGSTKQQGFGQNVKPGTVRKNRNPDPVMEVRKGTQETSARASVSIQHDDDDDLCARYGHPRSRKRSEGTDNTVSVRGPRLDAVVLVARSSRHRPVSPLPQRNGHAENKPDPDPIPIGLAPSTPGVARTPPSVPKQLHCPGCWC
uniref:Uncharacterized protein n=1 Tax=Anopheles maculatus TaxID=74869 RepID=A0A182T7L9_9DIPT